MRYAAEQLDGGGIMLSGQGWRIERVETPDRRSRGTRLRLEGWPEFVVTAEAMVVELPEGFLEELLARLAQGKPLG